MTKNEIIAGLLLEAAELLRDDPEQESLNEGAIETALSLGAAAILSLPVIGGAVYMIKSEIKDREKRKKELENMDKEIKNKRKKELENMIKHAKVVYDNNIFRKNQFIESGSKNIITINNDDDLRKLILKDARKLVSLCNKSKKVKEEFEKSFKEEFTEDELNDKRFHDFGGLHVKDEGDFIEIIDGTQDDRIILGWFINDLADVLEEKWGVDIGRGDGDEGCIYLW